MREQLAGQPLVGVEAHAVLVDFLHQHREIAPPELASQQVVPVLSPHREVKDPEEVVETAETGLNLALVPQPEHGHEDAQILKEAVAQAHDALTAQFLGQHLGQCPERVRVIQHEGVRCQLADAPRVVREDRDIPQRP